MYWSVAGYIGPGIRVSNGCIIGAGCELTVPEKLKDNSVFWGSECALTIASDKPPVSLSNTFLFCYLVLF